MGLNREDSEPVEGVPASSQIEQKVRSFDARLDAHSAADYLIFSGIPADQVNVVGRDLPLDSEQYRPVDAAHGRLAPGWVIAVTVITGAWVGLLIGLVASFFVAMIAPGINLVALVGGIVVVGTIAGLVLGLKIARGEAIRRELAVTWHTADVWDVFVRGDNARDARRLLVARDHANRS